MVWYVKAYVNNKIGLRTEMFLISDDMKVPFYWKYFRSPPRYVLFHLAQHLITTGALETERWNPQLEHSCGHALQTELRLSPNKTQLETENSWNQKK